MKWSLFVGYTCAQYHDSGSVIQTVLVRQHFNGQGHGSEEPKTWLPENSELGLLQAGHETLVCSCQMLVYTYCQTLALYFGLHFS